MEDALNQKQVSAAALEEAIDRSFAAARRLVAVREAELVCAALLLVMAANLFTSISRNSITNDESSTFLRDTTILSRETSNSTTNTRPWWRRAVPFYEVFPKW